jgi:ribonuclease-3
VDHPVQETTFKRPYSINGSENFASVNAWLDALYAPLKDEVSQKILLQNLNAGIFSQIFSIQTMQNELGYAFKNKNILINALTQSTFCYEFKELSASSNERLEFVGDSLVNFIVAKILYKSFPELSEGDLSKLRGSLVNEHSLSKLANAISLGENLLLGKGEHKNGGEKKESILADAFEAICAAVYLDSQESTEAVEKIFMAAVELYERASGKKYFALENLENFDSKTQLQELSMAMFQVHPTYKSEESKEGSVSLFKVEIWIGGRKLAEGKGPSKKKLEKQLARVVLDEKRYL